MKRLLLALFAATFLVAATSSPEPPRSIAAINVFGHGISCTAFSINEAKHYWVTANHCVDDHSAHYFVDRLAAAVVDQNEDDDMAVLHTGVGAEALEIASEEPVPGDVVFALGYPGGSPLPIWSGLGYVWSNNVRGKMYEEDFTKQPLARFYMMSTMVVFMGHSGSPVFDNGQVVGVVQGKTRFFTFSSRYKAFVKYIKPYLPK